MSVGNSTVDADGTECQTDSSQDSHVADRRKQPGTSSYKSNWSNQTASRFAAVLAGCSSSSDAWPGMSAIRGALRSLK